MLQNGLENNLKKSKQQGKQQLEIELFPQVEELVQEDYLTCLHQKKGLTQKE